ncbi:helix-turn-helix domain-containing protein [Dysgonomonas sp. 511]|uniref:helix-turn-helix domain-containing protein n=1 Tax=Dysgonomonas sp. 511 TaxID=2302930 RepID=UPI0013CF9810|nr:helix-turn-helix domain-containing protein [Dysgonomonas sp. 511]
MKKLESIRMISQGFNDISTHLSHIVEGLKRIEILLDGKKLVDGNSDNSSDSFSDGSNMHINPNEVLNKTQAAEVLNISARTLDRYRKKGIIPFYQIDKGKVSFRYKDLISVRDKVKGNNHGRNHFSELVSVSND